jgi:TetR/AcrR family transcriptional regulator, lmrAB and yxaGH operons repressor
MSECIESGDAHGKRDPCRDDRGRDPAPGDRGRTWGIALESARAHRGATRIRIPPLPGGKEQLILAALDLTGQRHDRFVERFRGTSAEEITAGYLELWRRILLRSGLESGCPILAVTVSASAGPLLDRAGEIFRTSQRHLVDLYEEVGVLRSTAERFVTFLVASAEGAVVLSRAQQDIEPFEVVADQLIEQSAAMPRVVSTTAGHQAATRTSPGHL